jgi:SAM-dependent methyltransferase
MLDKLEFFHVSRLNFYNIPICSASQSLSADIYDIIVSGMSQDFQPILSTIAQYAVKPDLFEPGEPHFWDDPHIAKGMLEAHLNPTHDAASHRPETIDKEVKNLIASGALKLGDKVLDLGCGPGLYASRLASQGVKVTGVDISQNSLNYATKQAKEKDLDIVYHLMSFFDIDYSGEFDAAIQTEGEIGTFSNDKRDILLAKIHHALKSRGLLVFDVTTPAQNPNPCPRFHWYIADGGFWRPGRHLMLEQRFNYPEDDVYVDQYIVMDEDNLTVYRIWNHNYTLDSLKPVLEKAGFQIEHAWNDLAGAPYREGGEWLAIVARKG